MPSNPPRGPRSATRDRPRWLQALARARQSSSLRRRPICWKQACAARLSKILAISFKGDAAGNLADRVKQRCPAEFSDRFTSITFDAFTKNLVDRFHTAIPAEWRPTKPYEIAFWDYKSTNYWLTRARLAAPEPWKAEIEEIRSFEFRGSNGGGQTHARSSPGTAIRG